MAKTRAHDKRILVKLRNKRVSLAHIRSHNLQLCFKTSTEDTNEIQMKYIESSINTASAI